MILIIICYVAYAAIFLSFSFFVFKEMFTILSHGSNKVYRTEKDAWDEVDGGTYVTMSDGSVRLDNNGGR